MLDPLEEGLVTTKPGSTRAGAISPGSPLMPGRPSGEGKGSQNRDSKNRGPFPADGQGRHFWGHGRDGWGGFFLDTSCGEVPADWEFRWNFDAFRQAGKLAFPENGGGLRRADGANNAD